MLVFLFHLVFCHIKLSIRPNEHKNFYPQDETAVRKKWYFSTIMPFDEHEVQCAKWYRGGQKDGFISQISEVLQQSRCHCFLYPVPTMEARLSWLALFPTKLPYNLSLH